MGESRDQENRLEPRYGTAGAVLLRGASVILLAVAVVAIIRKLEAGYGHDGLQGWIEREVSGQGVGGIALFVGAGAILTGVGLSRQVLAFAAGCAFGVAAGTGLALSAEVIGLIMAFLYARYLGRNFVARKFPRRLGQIDAILGYNPFLMTLALRLLPFSSNLAINLAAGVSNVPIWPFIVASAIGHLPQTLVFAMIGSGLTDGLALKSALALALFAASVWIGIHLYRSYRRDRADRRATEPPLHTPAIAALDRKAP
jgi:uncharacterized membrane protein YdjX (TVP38/TMEM64 family)